MGRPLAKGLAVVAVGTGALGICYIGYRADKTHQYEQRVQYANSTIAKSQEQLATLTKTIDSFYQEGQSIFLRENLTESELAAVRGKLESVKVDAEEYHIQAEDLTDDAGGIQETKDALVKKVNLVNDKLTIQEKTNNLFENPVSSWQKPVNDVVIKKDISQGITHILCTPHHNNGKYVNPKAAVIDKVTELQAELDRRNLPLTLLEGQEVRITGDLVEEIQQDQILFTNLADTYLLIEFPTMDVPAYTEQLFFKLRNMGKVPVIVHPERNAKFREDPNRLIPYLEMGCLAQLTAPSYIGVFGKDIQKTAKQMVEHNLVQMMASDAHGIKKRTFAMKEAFTQIEKDFGSDKVAQMQQVAKDLINGDAVTYPTYQEIKKKRFGLF